jgi:hypothetical protein
MKSIKDFRYTPRADMATDIRDVLELVQYLHTLEERVANLEALLKGKEFVQQIKEMK